jgi:peptide/nickel transport system substrate-binding protein
LGKPQYGGTMTLGINKDIASFDPINTETLMTISTSWLEQLFVTDWTMDPSVQNYQLSFWSDSQAKGGLAESWEFTAPGVFVLHLRQGIHWQNIPPASGREFVADDVVFHFNRMLGLGGGFTKPAPYWGTTATWKSLLSVTATDKYTVVMKWNTPNPEFVTENLEAPGTAVAIENPEAVKLWGDLNDWHHAIGTGPFILKDFISGSSANLVKNPDYWAYDERYPQNRLPYIDTLKILIIPDNATALAAMRTGKIDILDNMSFQQAQQMQKTNPEIVQISVPTGNAITIDPRNDKAPFSDIRVRQALQMAIDLPTIAQNFYAGTASPSPSTLTSNFMPGWGFPYSQWPQDLKDQYAYNPTGAKQLLAAAGYPTGFKTNIVADVVVDMDLLQIVKSYFSAVGIDMEIRTMDSASFSAFVVSGHKNDALAIRGPGALGVTYYPLRQFTKFQTGASSNTVVVSDPVFDAFYPKALAATSTNDLKAVLTDANKYVAQQHFAISLLQPNLFSLCQPWLKGFNAQYCSTAGTSIPGFLFFYEARFWVNQNLKTASGH